MSHRTYSIDALLLGVLQNGMTSSCVPHKMMPGESVLHTGPNGPEVQPKGFPWVSNGIGSLKFSYVFLRFCWDPTNLCRKIRSPEKPWIPHPHRESCGVCASFRASKHSMDGVIFFRSLRRPWNTARSHEARNDACDRSISWWWLLAEASGKYGENGGLRSWVQAHKKHRFQATHPWQCASAQCPKTRDFSKKPLRHQCKETEKGHDVNIYIYPVESK